MDFRERALHEARRYGSDPFVFVRELIQNARDAAARSAHFEVATRDGVSRVSCRDDGFGMSLEHARRFLFTLYASSKQGRSEVGRFGVGFWSVLRFEPSRIVVRSWPRQSEPWEISLSGDLTSATQRQPPSCRAPGGHGTEVVLERTGEDPELLRRVRDAAWQGARFVSRRDDPRTPLDLRVNDAPVTAAFELPRPSATFRRGRHRGVVALGREARVELFARGLRVRSAAALHDLAVGATSASRVRFPETEGLVPQALLDGDDLEPLLARSDVRDDRSLRRLLGLAEGTLAHLVERQLALARPEAAWRRAGRLLAVPAILALGAAAGRLAWLARPAPSDALSRNEAPASSDPLGLVGRTGVRPFRDPSADYAGPRASGLRAGESAPLLFYRPPEQRLYLASLLLDDVTSPPPPARSVGPYRGAPCEERCLEITLLFEAGPGIVRLPRATGHLLDPASLRVGGQTVALGTGPAGEPVLALERAEQQVVSYRSSPARGSFPAATSAAPAPRELLEAAAAIVSTSPVEARVPASLLWVREHVRYSMAEADVARHRAAEAAGVGLLERALRIGAGDCDVQNAVLTVLLRSAGVPARLAVGHVGENGSALPALHAWVEWSDRFGSVQVADASEDAALAAPGASSLALGAPALLATPAAPAWRRVGAALLLVLSAGLSAVLLAARRTRRRVALDPAHDVARLLRGALAQPEAFRRVPAVFERRLVPLHPRGVARLGDVWEAAARRRLFRTELRSALAHQVAGAGALVVDTRRAEGRVVADALAAIDLDAWDALLARSRGGRLLARVERAFRAGGEPVRLRRAPALGAPVVVDLPGRRLSRGLRRTLVLDADEPWLLAADRLAADKPAEAAFVLADHVARLLRLDARPCARVLAPIARAALVERR